MFEQLFTPVDVLSFDEAVYRHAMLQEALKQLLPEHGTPKNIGKMIVDYAQDAWNECIGAGSPDSAIASALRSAVPLEYIPLLRMRSGIPAAYLISKLVEILANGAKGGEDLSDDMVLRRCVTEAFKSFEERRKNANQIEEGFGFDESDAWAQMRKIEDRTGEVSHLMKQVAALAGRMYKSFQYAAIPHKTNEPQEVEGVETGGAIDRMLDDEKASIGIDPDVAVRVSEDRANQFQMAGETTRSRGPLVVVVDESSSMHGHRAIWAKACSIALIRIALQEGRTVRMVHFSTVTDVHDVRPNVPDDMLLAAESHLSGGTNIQVAFEVSLDQVGDLEKNGLEGADIVFITDGECSYGEQPFKRMVQMGVQLWTVAIDVDLEVSARNANSSRGYGSSPWLYKYATAYVHISDATIRGNGDGAVKAALKLRNAALDNSTRADEASRA